MTPPQAKKSCLLRFALILITKMSCAQVPLSDMVGIEGESQGYCSVIENYPRDCSEVRRRCSSSNSSGVYVIQPEYSLPFPVYCDNDASSGGWTVIQRRTDQSVRFNRPWEQYEQGFGSLSQNHWLGNDKLFYLTNQANYELRVDMELSDGSSFFVTYSRFRISNASNHYSLSYLGNFTSGGNGTITRVVPCDPLRAHHCPDGFLLEGGDCIPRRECPCFWPEVDQVLENGQHYMNNDCTEIRTCTNYRLIRGEVPESRCGPNAHCVAIGGVRQEQCECDAGFVKIGQRCAGWKDCHYIYTSGQTQDGIYAVRPVNWYGSPFEVYCKDNGWMVIQRQSGSENFYRSWSDYKNGFGSYDEGMWLGNEKIYHFTNQGDYELRIDLIDRNGNRYFASYSVFRIDSESEKYRLQSLGTYRGNAAGYNALLRLRGKQFSTYDQDNDGWSRFNCAEKHRGGWWFGQFNSLDSSKSDFCRRMEVLCNHFPDGGGCANCAVVNLNGDRRGTRGENLFWGGLSGYDCGIEFTEMKIRPTRN